MKKTTIKHLHDAIIRMARQTNRKVEKCSCGNGKVFFFFTCQTCNGTGIYLK